MTDSSQQPIFRVDKYQAYEEEAVLFEQYSILMYGSEKLCCTRPEMEQLSNLIQRAYSGGYPFSISGDIRSVPS